MRSASGVIFIAVFLGVILPVTAMAETLISGEINSSMFDPAKNPFIVEKDIFVPEGKQVEIPAGCIFLFSTFTGLIVHGQVKVLGSQEKPVVFTSVFDSDYNPASNQLPNPFDWNGILVSTTSAGSYFNNFNLRYSVYGIKSQSQNVVIQNGMFRQNGQFHFTIYENIQFVQDNIPYSYGASQNASPNNGNGTKAGKAESSETKTAKGGRTSRQTKIVRFVCLGVAIAGAGTGTVFTIRSARLNNELNDKTLWDVYSEGGTRTEEDHNQTEQDANQGTVGAIVSYGIGLLGLVGFGITFAF
jgi:hypothetical protein